MQTPDTAALVTEILAAHFERAVERITPETQLRVDLCADSLDALEIVFDLEEGLGRSFDDLVPGEWHTVGDVIEAVRGIVEGAPA